MWGESPEQAWRGGKRRRAGVAGIPGAGGRVPLQHLTVSRPQVTEKPACRGALNAGLTHGGSARRRSGSLPCGGPVDPVLPHPRERTKQPGEVMCPALVPWPGLGRRKWSGTLNPRPTPGSRPAPPCCGHRRGLPQALQEDPGGGPGNAGPGRAGPAPLRAPLPPALPGRRPPALAGRVLSRFAKPSVKGGNDAP